MFDLTERRAGVLLHPTSLPGPDGIGDLGEEAHRFVDWAASAGLRLWQWLPVNPIGPGNSPYQSVSAFAGSPWMVALLPLRKAGWLDPEADAAAAGTHERAEFDTRRVQFERVLPWRDRQLRRASAGFAARATAGDRTRLQAWAASQAHWLDDYALFMALRTHEQERPWWDWPAPWRDRDPAALREAAQALAPELAHWRFVQWCFDEQVGQLRAHAARRGVALVGDLPIFIAHDSVDVWSARHLYRLDAAGQPTVVAGVPPDGLSPEGQRWGNPLYHWPRMAEDRHAWWVARLRRALVHADVVRIDHFRGFAACWEIPADEPTAAGGRWSPGPGRALFDDLREALGPLPIIAEDLGTITPDVVELLQACGFPGMKILQFAFGGDGHHPFLPHSYPRDCVVYTGTHDNDTARGWWDHAPEHERRFCARYLGCSTDDVHRAMIRGALQSVAALALFPLQDALGRPSADRMNLPGTQGGHWAWRFARHDLTPDLTQTLATLAADSGRLA